MPENLPVTKLSMALRAVSAHISARVSHSSLHPYFELVDTTTQVAASRSGSAPRDLEARKRDCYHLEQKLRSKRQVDLVARRYQLKCA